MKTQPQIKSAKPDLKVIWESMNDWLLAFVTAEVKDTHTARDIVQEVYLKVQLNLHKVRDEEKLTSWIFRIARNQIADHFRKKARLLEANMNLEAKDHTGPSTNNGHEQLALCIRPMIDLLPEKYRQAMILSEIKGMSQKELADELQISYSGAKSRVQRGRQMLKETLNQCCEISTDAYGNVLDYKQRSCDPDCD